LTTDIGSNAAIYNDNKMGAPVQANFGKKWRNYATIIELADGKLNQIDEVVKEPLEKCLLYLAYKTDRNKTDTLLHNEAMKKMR
jgi:hypothetical protein